MFHQNPSTSDGGNQSRLQFCFFFVSLAVSVQTSFGFPGFRDNIPNGYTVPNPDIPGSVWSGVGHFAAGGGGPRNPFGEDFKANGYKWTQELCEMDSDGDGRTNGEELGDPRCLWDAENPLREPEFPASSHPGIPDSIAETPNSDTCANYDPPADTKELDITFTNPVNLDGSRTQYMCEQFRVESPNRWTSYHHQIKTEPLVDNADVLHHIWVYSCDGTTSSDGKRVGQGSYSCSGIEGNCQIVAGWAVGGRELCEPDNVGAGITFGGFSGSGIFKVEAHYDNTLGQPTTDQSGMRLHLTRNLRPLDAGFVILGMDYWDRQFELEAGQTSVSRRNICPSEATMRLQNPIYIYGWNPHMHLYGRSLVTEHYRCGEKIGEIGNIPNYEFDNQQGYVLDPPVKVLPGDSLVTTCTYDTSQALGNIGGGEETTDEMCDNYVSFYPSAYTPWRPNLFTACVAYEDGVSPEYLGYEDNSRFVILDLGGDIIINNHDANPQNSVAPCCARGGAAACEEEFLASLGEPCGTSNDCATGLVCSGSQCQRGRSGQIRMGSP